MPKLLIIFALALALPTSQLTAATLVTTDRVVSDMTAERDRVNAFLQRGEVQRKMIALGVSPAEATERLASLSDQEVAKVAGRLDSLKAGGDGIYLGLGAIVIIVLLILLLRR